MTWSISLADAIKKVVAEHEPSESEQAILLYVGDSITCTLRITIHPADGSKVNPVNPPRDDYIPLLNMVVVL